MKIDKSTKLKPIVRPNYNGPLHPLTIQEMWSTVNKSQNIQGIEGYDISIKHFDYKQNKFDRETFNLNMQVWAKKAKYPPPVLPKDKDGNNVIPVKKNFIDEEILKAKSYYSPEKAEKYAESKSLEPYVRKPNDKSYLYAHDRETYINKVYREKKFEQTLNEALTERADKVKEKQAELLKTKKHWTEILKEKYRNKCNWSKDARTGIYAEAEYVGEKNPFYNSYKKKGEEDSKPEKEFFPNILSKKQIVPKYYKQTVLNTEPAERKAELIQEKIDKVKQKWEERNIKFSGLMSENFDKVKSRGRLYFIYKDVS
jgi:hypothetical protein